MEILKDTIIELVGDNGKADKLLDLFRRENDRSISQATETYKSKTLPGLVTAEVERLTNNPEDRIKKKESEISLREKAIMLSEQTKLPYQIILRNLRGNETEDLAAVEDLIELVKKTQIDKATEMLRQSAYKPTDSNSHAATYTIESLARIPAAERNRLREAGAFDQLLGRR